MQLIKKVNFIELFFKNDKDSIAVKQFWNEYKILDVENTLKLVEKQTNLQMAISDVSSFELCLLL